MKVQFNAPGAAGCMTKFFRRAKSSAKASASFSLSPQRGEGWGEGWAGSRSAAGSHIFFLEICREFGGHKNFVLHPAQLDTATVWSSAFTRSNVRSATDRLKAELQTPNLIAIVAVSRCAPARRAHLDTVLHFGATPSPQTHSPRGGEGEEGRAASF